MDYFKLENDQTKKMFNLDDILNFQLNNDVQIIRGSDFQYYCYINKECFANSLTTLNALVVGIEKYKECKKKLYLI